jgi:hypothetical protein
MPKKSYEMDTTWDEIGWTEYGNGAVTSMFVIGDPSDPDAPTVFRGYFPPGARVEPHHHLTDYTEIILAGSQTITRKEHRAGTVRVVAAGTAYGPLIAGPEGCETIVVFRNQNWGSQGIKVPMDVAGSISRPSQLLIP